MSWPRRSCAETPSNIPASQASASTKAQQPGPAAPKSGKTTSIAEAPRGSTDQPAWMPQSHARAEKMRRPEHPGVAVGLRLRDRGQRSVAQRLA
jgi:hypothetical protein